MVLDNTEQSCSCNESGDCTCEPFDCFCECECDGCLIDMEEMTGCPCGGNCGCS